MENYLLDISLLWVFLGLPIGALLVSKFGFKFYLVLELGLLGSAYLVFFAARVTSNQLRSMGFTFEANALLLVPIIFLLVIHIGSFLWIKPFPRMGRI